MSEDICISTHTLTCPDGLPLGLDVHRPLSGQTFPLTVLCHGFKGFRRWGLFPELASRLAEGGRVVALVDLSHNGTAPGSETEFTRLDLFERQTFPRHVADLRQVLAALLTESLRSKLGVSSDGAWLVGHSMGGGMALLTAVEEPLVSGLITLNGIGRADRVAPELAAVMLSEGRALIPNARTGQQMPLAVGFLQSARATDLAAAAAAVNVPTLVISGDLDSVVPPHEAVLLLQHYTQARHEVVPGGDHTFGACHPWQGWTEPADRVFQLLHETLPRSFR